MEHLAQAKMKPLETGPDVRAGTREGVRARTREGVWAGTRGRSRPSGIAGRLLPAGLLIVCFTWVNVEAGI